MNPLLLSLALQTATIQVDDRSPGKPISDLIYGRNDLSFGKSDTDLVYPIVRFGGNATSRYNWQENAWNTGKDWYFENIGLPYAGSLSYTDAIIVNQSTLGQDTLITVPIIGWVAKSRAKLSAYPQTKFGKQQASEGDAGNGRLPDGSPLKKGDPTLTSRPAPPEFIAAWVKHNQVLKGGRVRFYALDNEPMLWHDTHQDVRYGDKTLKSAEVGYDELWERTVAYGSAVRAADPKAQILGPVEWGWCSYLTSAKDQCKPGPDRAAHGGKPLLAWYLHQVCAHQKKTGVRLVDYLDIHYYSQTEKALDDETPKGQKLRLDAVRSLYEKGFKDGSWIDEPIELIPRMQRWIQEECPGTKLAITEYRFGAAAEGLSSTLANAETLAIFGREGVDLATYWGHIPKGSKLEGAFALYLNYDGKGASARSGQSLAVKSSNDVPAYAIQTKDRLLLYVFNKSLKAVKLQWQGLNDWTVGRRFTISAQRNLAEDKGGDQLDARTVALYEFKRPSQSGKHAAGSGGD